MDQCTKEVRKQQWKNIISQCQSRPEGQTVKEWLKENGICEQTYYLWQRRIRQEAFDEMQQPQNALPAVNRNDEVAFAEFPMASKITQNATLANEFVNPAAVIRTPVITIAVTADIPEHLLTTILREVSHA